MLSTDLSSLSNLASKESSVTSDKSMAYCPKIENTSVSNLSWNKRSVGFGPDLGT